jgi:hypothetical protein
VLADAARNLDVELREPLPDRLGLRLFPGPALPRASSRAIWRLLSVTASAARGNR